MEELSIDVGDFWVGSEVKILENPSSIEFLRECVASYQPAILRGLTDDWPAMIEWDLARICEKLDQASGERLLKVNLTPDGRADCLKSISVCAPKTPFDVCTDISPDVYSDIPASISSVSVPNITLKENSDSHPSESVFLYPAECYMPTSLFQEMMINPLEGDAVPYLSLQNDNLRMDMPELMGDVAASLRIAEEAFGQSQPEAVNLWIGDERSVSATHKDHFENMYAVITGEKTFTLLPPTDILYLKTRECSTMKYEVKSSYHNLGDNGDSGDNLDDNGDDNRDDHRGIISGVSGVSVAFENAKNASDGSIARKHSDCTSNQSTDTETTLHRRLTTDDLELKKNSTLPGTISWIETDPDSYDVLRNNPNFKYAHPLRCTVRPGEILYIPAMWYHQVSQTKLTIAVNYWYDQRFDFRFVFYQSINRLKDTLDAARSTYEQDRTDQTELEKINRTIPCKQG